MRDTRPLVVVVDGHGGGMGKALVARLRERLPQVHVRAVGTNSAAPAAMLKGGAAAGAAGACIMSGFMASGDPAEYVRRLRERVDANEKLQR